MTRDEYLKILNKAFGDFKFYEDGHYYQYKGKNVGISVTRFIDQYVNEFKQQEIAERVANKEGRDVQDVLAEWKYKADFACTKGSTCHSFAQILWSGNEWDYLPFDKSQKYLEAVIKIKDQACEFYSDYKDRLEHLADEFVIGSEEYDIASAIDHLFINKLTGGLVLVDYKTNSYLSGYNKKAYKKAMKVPLQHLNDDALHHYYIQLSIYRFLLEKYTGLEVSEMFIVYMSENIDNYEIIEIPYLKDEVEKILEWRKWE